MRQKTISLHSRSIPITRDNLIIHVSESLVRYAIENKPYGFSTKLTPEERELIKK